MRDTGYLVVLKPGWFSSPRNPAYRGINRIPEYPSSVSEEAMPLDRLIFSGILDEDGFIPSLPLAKSTLTGFSRSCREFEIIFCSSEGEPEPIGKGKLGYDVAVRGGAFWSIVRDLSPTLPAMGLNSSGLFDAHSAGVKYLEAYKLKNLADCDLTFRIFAVFLIEQ